MRRNLELIREGVPLSHLRQQINELKSKIADLKVLISEIESGPRREIDIADQHTGNPTFIARSVLLDGERGKGRWYVRESIYCSLERCPNCPHREYAYTYSYNKRKRIATVKFTGIPVFEIDDLKAMASDRKTFFDEFGRFLPES
jgi:hypothetical protein